MRKGKFAPTKPVYQPPSQLVWTDEKLATLDSKQLLNLLANLHTQRVCGRVAEETATELEQRIRARLPTRAVAVRRKRARSEVMLEARVAEQLGALAAQLAARYDLSPETAARIISAPEIDGPDQSPADAFASATIYVVPRNAQYHLDPSGQKVVTGLWSSLIKMREESTFFERLQNKYKLGDQTIEIWRRKPWTPDKLLRGLYLIGEEVQYMRPWVATQSGDGIRIIQNLQDTQILARPGSVQKAVSLFLLVPLEAGKYNVSAQVRKEDSCGPLYIRARIDDMLGKTTYEKTGGTADQVALFEEPLALKDKETGFLSLDLWRAQNTPCMIQLDGLKVERTP